MKVIALIGGSGAGKSTVLQGLTAHFGNRLAVLSLDNYYRPKEELPVDENGETNFDLPEVIDHEALVRDVDALARGEAVELQTYTYNRDVMVPEPLRIAPAPLLVVEGLFVLASEGMRRRTDAIGYIDAPVEVRLERRIRRDGIEQPAQLGMLACRSNGKPLQPATPAPAPSGGGGLKFGGGR